ncbi:MAG: hypothetical protein V1720_13990 [bacterium]
MILISLSALLACSSETENYKENAPSDSLTKNYSKPPEPGTVKILGEVKSIIQQDNVYCLQVCIEEILEYGSAAPIFSPSSIIDIEIPQAEYETKSISGGSEILKNNIYEFLLKSSPAGKSVPTNGSIRIIYIRQSTSREE